MPRIFPTDSVGLVTPQRMDVQEPLTLACARVLDSYTLVYETYGTLNADKSNAVLICHALSGHHHAAGYHHENDTKAGWWDNCIGPNKAIDTNQFFVVALNNLGGCHGSSGPSSLNPETGRIYGPDFPLVTVRDWVQVQARLSDYLGIDCWAAIVGGSLGGMQVLQWAVDFPARLRSAVIIASAPKLSAQNIAFNEVARQSILSDPDFYGGRYTEMDTIPKRGLILARMVGHITYLSDDAMKQKFGRDLKSGKFLYGYDVEFQVESYLRHQGEVFSQNFDANTYLLMTKALDYFDPAREFDDNLQTALARASSQEIVNALMAQGKQVAYADIDAPQGHDSFLFPIPRYVTLLKNFMNSIDGGRHAS
jgi:homoserine O-acetyltransferase